MKRTGPTNIQMKSLIQELRKKAIEDKVPLWKRLADDLEKPTRQRRVVNLARINRFAKENEVVVVPGKVLSAGNLDHKVTVSAFSFSSGAQSKITDAKGEMMSISELMKKYPKGQKVRILG